MVNSTQSKTQQSPGPIAGSSCDSSASGPECLICSQPSTKRCSNCHEANYCSSDHQRQHWKQHKKVCLPYKICKTPILGLHLVAMRDLEERCPIIQETPMAFAPFDDDSSSSIHSDPICFGCCIRMSIQSSRRCTKCHWPICSPSCEKLKHHAENECKIFSESKTNFPPNKSEAVYTSVLVLRLVLQKKANPSQWKKLMDLKHHEKLRKSKRKYEREVEMIMENLLEFVSSEERLYKLVTKQELAEVMERVILNSFVVSRREEDKADKTFVRGIYVKAGLACYGCIPNSVWSLSFSPNFSMTLQASVRIERGQVIQIPLSNQWIFEGTYQRQINAYDDLIYSCRCSRCIDPTECGTYLSAIKCTSCPRGYLLPKNPVDFNAEALWQCTTNNSCTQLEEQEKIMSILHYFEIDTSKAIAGIHDQTDITTKLDMIDEMYTQYLESRLHENHFIILSLQNEFIQAAFQSLQHLTYPQLDRLIFHSEHLLNISSILYPGFNSHLAMLRNCLGQAMLRKRVKAAKDGQTLSVFGSPIILVEYLTRLDQLQKACLVFYERDPSTKLSVGGTSSIVKKLLEDNAAVIRDIKLATSNLLK